jgi:hypothetical protein
MPRTMCSRPAATVAPSARLVMNERTLKRPMGVVFAGAVPGATQAHGLSGMR